MNTSIKRAGRQAFNSGEQSEHGGYGIIANEIFYQGLSATALIILFYMIGKRPNWQIWCYDIERELGFGAKKRRTGMADLKKLNYFEQKIGKDCDIITVNVLLRHNLPELRAQHDGGQGYYQINNLFFRLGLSVDAIALLFYWHHKHPNWQFDYQDTKETLSMSGNRMSSTLAELKRAGLIHEWRGQKKRVRKLLRDKLPSIQY